MLSAGKFRVPGEEEQKTPTTSKDVFTNYITSYKYPDNYLNKLWRREEKCPDVMSSEQQVIDRYVYRKRAPRANVGNNPFIEHSKKIFADDGFAKFVAANNLKGTHKENISKFMKYVGSTYNKQTAETQTVKKELQAMQPLGMRAMQPIASVPSLRPVAEPRRYVRIGTNDGNQYDIPEGLNWNKFQSYFFSVYPIQPRRKLNTIISEVYKKYALFGKPIVA